MPTTDTKTIIPAGGGDYTTLQAWEAGEAANLVTADKIAQAEVHRGGTASDNTTLVINAGWTTDATRHIDIVAAAGQEHDGTLDGSQSPAPARFETTADVPLCEWKRIIHTERMQYLCTKRMDIRAEDAALIMKRCQLVGNGIANNLNDLLRYRGDAIPGLVENSQLIINSGPANNASVFGIVGGGSGDTTLVDIYGCALIADADSPNGNLQCFRTKSSATNVITEDNNYAFNAASSNPLVYQAQDSGTINKGANTATYNTEATTASLRSILYSTATFSSVTNAAQVLLHPGAVGTLVDVGADLTGTQTAESITGIARVAPWDIGPDEFVVAGAGEAGTVGYPFFFAGRGRSGIFKRPR